MGKEWELGGRESRGLGGRDWGGKWGEISHLGNVSAGLVRERRSPSFVNHTFVYVGRKLRLVCCQVWLRDSNLSLSGVHDSKKLWLA